MVEFSGFTIIAFYSVCILQAGPIIDFRSMINDATRLNVEEGQDDRLLKPLGGYLGYSSEWRDLAQVISRVSQYQSVSALGLLLLHLVNHVAICTCYQLNS